MAIYAVGFFLDGKMVAIDGCEFLHIKNVQRQMEGLKTDHVYKEIDGLEFRIIQILVKDMYGCVLRYKEVKL